MWGTAVMITGIVAGSALGGVARLWLSRAVTRLRGERFPWGTLAVNLSGAALIGATAGVLAPPPDQGAWNPAWAALVVGFLGSYTTVSSFALQTLLLARDRRRGAALAYVLVSAAGCLAAAGTTLWLLRQLVPA